MNRLWSATRLAAAIAVALLGSVIVWVAVPYNNFRLQNTYLSDSFLPEIVVAFLLLVILAVNPLLRLIRPAWMLNQQQVALIASLMLFAAVIPSNGLMRMFPRFVAGMNQSLYGNVTTTKIAADARLRQALFPDPVPTRSADGRVQTAETPLSDQFIDELDEGATVPWRAWVKPMASWGMLIMAMWAMMIGLGGVVYPQWRDQERLPFPLLNVYQSLIGDPDDQPGQVLPAVFRSRAFWIGCTVVFLIHASRGLEITTGGGFPSFPLSWNLKSYFTDGILQYATQPLFAHSIFFSVVGVAYFMPSRYSVSVWGWVVAYAVYMMFGKAFVPAFQEGQVEDQAFGALLAITLWVLWLGRAHWAKVGRAMFGRAADRETGRRDAVAGWMFAIGCAGIVFWLYWAGCSLWWSVLAMVGCAVVALLMARIIAETGIPVFWLGRMSVAGLTALFPLTWQSPQILLFTGAFYALLTRTTAVSASVMSTLALGVNREATPALQRRLLLGGLALMAIGFVVCGAVHLDMGYHSAEVTTEGKTDATTLNGWARAGRTNYEFFTVDRGHQAAGFGISSALLWACSRFPAWPIHPVGIIFCRLSIGNLIWFSVFLGWLAKSTISGLFGGGACRKARPLFLGLIMGELLAIIVWAIIPVVIIWATGADPSQVPRYTLMQYR